MAEDNDLPPMLDPGRDLHEQFVEILRDSPLFDGDWYCRSVGVELPLDEAVEHYLSEGDARGFSPSIDFEVHFYRKTYPDVVESGMNSLLHYLLHGQQENRYPAMSVLEKDIALISSSGLFDAALYARESGKTFFSPEEAVRHYLFLGESLNYRPCVEFDRQFYRDSYDDLRGSSFAHYVSVGVFEARIASPEKLERIMSSAAVGHKFDAEHYCEIAGLRDCPDEDALAHYFKHGVRLGLEPCARFDYEYYLETNPDLKRVAGLHHSHLFWHFAEHGEREGRRAWIDLNSVLSAGGKAFVPGRKTCLCVNHDATRTGAPLVGLNLVRTLSTRYNVITFTGRKGELDAAFARYSCLYGAYSPSRSQCKLLLEQLAGIRDISFAVVNSVETVVFANALADVGIPTVSLVHEFAEYSLPKGKVTEMVAASDRSIFSADLVYQSLRNDMKRGAFPSIDAANSVIRPQGLLPFLPKTQAAAKLSMEDLRNYLGLGESSGAKVVLGAGFVQARKGVDMFVQTAIRFRALHGDDFRFLWIGEGYRPDADANYSVWIRDAIQRAGLEKNVFMLDSQSDLDTAFELADVFFLPSRLDPFPNVVIDALQANVPVVCFDHATGCAEFLRSHRAAAYIAAYLDPNDAAAGIANCLDPAYLAQFVAGTEIVRRELDFDAYVGFIEAQVGKAVEKKQRQALRLDSLLGGKGFDPVFFAGKASFDSKAQLLAQYLSGLETSILGFAPRPGFDPFLAGRSAIESQGNAFSDTHRCYRYSETEGLPAADDLKVAVHLHLHYADLARGFADAFAPCQDRFDFFVSTNDEKDAEAILSELDFRSLQVRVFPNRGRNFGALLTADFADELRNYDLVGHFHGKKSVHGGENAGFGGSWRNFILASLAGLRGEVLPFVLERFAADPGLGLLFPEDRHLVGWGANEPHARELLDSMGIRTALPAYCRFPLGGMFWARPAVLAPLWNLGLGWNDLPVEPLPYDGSMLHALERVMPLVAESAGMRWATLYRAGISW